MTKHYSFSEFNEARMNATCTQWRKDAAKGMAFPADVEQVLEWAETHAVHQETDSMAFGIFDKGSAVADGIVEVVVSRPRPSAPWVKMLRLRLKPSLDERIYNKEIEAQAEALQVFMAAVQGVAGLTSVHKAVVMKIFGRSNDQLAFLQSLAVHLQKELKGAKTSIKGRWLTVEV